MGKEAVILGTENNWPENDSGSPSRRIYVLFIP